MDFIEGLPLSKGHDTILVVVCCLTKMALFIPTFRDIDAEDLAHVFLSQVFAKHGTPTDIVSDRGKHFISRFWRSLCQLLSIKANLSTAYHPEMTGRPKESTRSWNNTFGFTSITNRMTGSTSCPLPNLHTTILRIRPPWSPPSSPTRAFTLNSKFPLRLLCRMRLTLLLQI